MCAQRQLEIGLVLRAQQQAAVLRAQAAQRGREVVQGLHGLLCLAQVQPYQAMLGLVRQVGRHALGHQWRGQRAEGGAHLRLAGGDRMAHHRQAGGLQPGQAGGLVQRDA